MIENSTETSGQPSPIWQTLEMRSVILTGYFREDADTGHQLVTTIAEMPCIVLELVAADGSRDSAGVIFTGLLDDARHDAQKLAADFAVPLIDCTVPEARRGQN